MQLCQKLKTFSVFFVFFFFFVFFKLRLNFEYFQKKDDPPSRWIFELTDSEKRG